MYKKYVVTLSDAERAELRAFVRKGQASARQLTRARVLLLSDAGHTDDQIAASLHVGTTTIERLRRRYVHGGLAAALHDRPRPGGAPKLDGKQAALLVALSCCDPPEGRPTWTMQLLADKLVAIGVVDSLSDETVRRVLKKTT